MLICLQTLKLCRTFAIPNETTTFLQGDNKNSVNETKQTNNQFFEPVAKCYKRQVPK